MTDRVVTVFGSSKIDESDEFYEFAGELGALIAERGYVLANGGYGGTMVASARGCSKHKGKTIGVTCSSFGRAGANEYVSQEIETDCLKNRLTTLVELGDAFVVLPGSTGTLLELAFVCELRNKGMFETDKPIVLFGDFWKPVIDCVAKEDDRFPGCVRYAESPEDAMEIIDEYFASQTEVSNE